jgi:LPPG:FO 2-phospho-L-lactate transferase
MTLAGQLEGSNATGGLKVAALAGGVGGAKLAHGLQHVLQPGNLTVIVNTGDDFRHLGLLICPDLDTVCYTLAGLGNPTTGWGRADEAWLAMETLEVLGGPIWFRLGDRDLGLHLERTRRFAAGQTLSQITADFCQSMGVNSQVLPMSDDAAPTWVYTSEGELPFQEYFVKRGCVPQVKGFRLAGAGLANPASGVLGALQAADLIVICPSNPWVSIDPILSIQGVRAAVAGGCVVAVSPIIAGAAVRGPAAKMYAELGIRPSAASVARHYGGLLSGFVLDNRDADQTGEIEALGIRVWGTDILMKTVADRSRLAAEVIDFAGKLMVR